MFCQLIPCPVVHFLSHYRMYPREANLTNMFITAAKKKQRKNSMQITRPVSAPLKAINIDLPKLGHASFSDIRVGFRKKKLYKCHRFIYINPLNPEFNPICYLLALLGAHHFLHVSRKRVKLLTFRRLMSYIYIYIWSTHS